uniref:Uncharacterized protein n=2 Tax=Enterobacteriaceae TaxID=543 RepID=A0A6H1Q5D5_ECOLX|nr:Hypothetical protein [Escherichia coli]QQM12569.1 hypothetical protein [Klebsiella pneumoniae subsp. pneumoniae]URZ91652.1 hypothetical protein [Klebsiella pneumoniae]WHO54357.1 hypothetical protein [Enterobacter hormaechei]BCD83421.1 hypothetical protein [Escherichia coli]
MALNVRTIERCIAAEPENFFPANECPCHRNGDKYARTITRTGSTHARPDRPGAIS